MFAKQAPFAVAALALTIAGGAFAQSAERNVFDTETALRQPAAVSAQGLTRAQVRAEFIAARARGDVSAFDTESVAMRENKAPTAERTTQLAQAGK